MQTLYAKLQHVHVERVISWFEWTLFAIALAAYVYFIAMSVVQVVLRQELLVSIQEAETHVSELEAVYFERSGEISRDIAQQYDLVALAPIAYVEVAPEGERLTRRDE